MAEFDLINRYFNFQNNNNEIVIGIGDDGAVLALHSQSLTSDSFLLQIDQEYEFSQEKTPDCLRVLSNNARAINAKPKYLLLNLILSNSENDKMNVFLQAFSNELKSQLEKYKITLVGGDTSSGPNQILFTLISQLE